MKSIARPKSISYVVIVVVLLCLIVAGVFVFNTYYQQFESLNQADAGTSTHDETTPTAILPEKLSYDNLFLNSALDNLDQSKLRVVVATGDIIPARGVDAQIRRQGVNYPFAGPGVSDILKAADVTVVDLEAPLLKECPAHNEGFTFCGQAAFAQAMAQAGIDIASLENNHIGNYGQSGIAETITYLDAAKIAWGTKNKLAIMEVDGLTFGLLSFNGVTSQTILNQGALEAIKQFKPQVDVLMVSVHWGKEYELVPASAPGIAPENPLDISHQLVDAGADLIIGNHPHWVQGVELYNDAVIAYAHGNFIFDQSWSVETSQGVIGRYTYYDKQLIKIEFLPIQIVNQAQPRLVEGQIKEDILSQIKQSTELIRQSRQ